MRHPPGSPPHEREPAGPPDDVPPGDDPPPADPPATDAPAGRWSRLLLVSTPFVLLLVLFLLDRWIRG